MIRGQTAFTFLLPYFSSSRVLCAPSRLGLLHMRDWSVVIGQHLSRFVGRQPPKYLLHGFRTLLNTIRSRNKSFTYPQRGQILWEIITPYLAHRSLDDTLTTEKFFKLSFFLSQTIELGMCVYKPRTCILTPTFRTLQNAYSHSFVQKICKLLYLISSQYRTCKASRSAVSAHPFLQKNEGIPPRHPHQRLECCPLFSYHARPGSLR